MGMLSYIHIEQGDDDIESAALREYIEKSETGHLNFPILTKKLYQSGKYKYMWLSPNNKSQLWDAMMLLDCVVQYGLLPKSYHPTELTYSNLNLITEDTILSNFLPQKAATDVLLTDALLTFMFHLHFGKFNPGISSADVDKENYSGFRIDSALKYALNSGPNFTQTVLAVQPQNKEYLDLQAYLKLITHQYSGDCYTISQDTAKLIAVNLERFRWHHSTDSPEYIDINIPSFTLKYIKGKKEEAFKVIVGKPSNPTPLLRSKIGFFTTGPDWTVPPKIFRNELLPKAIANPKYLEENNFAIYKRDGSIIPPTSENLKLIKKNPSNYYARQSAGCDNALGKIVFNFENRYNVYLHDTPDRSLFKKENRALSHGCIRVENPEKLVKLLLDAGRQQNTYSTVINSMRMYRKFRYTMKKPVPIIIRYTTCELKAGSLIKYPDLYSRDKQLINSLFAQGTHLYPISN